MSGFGVFCFFGITRILMESKEDEILNSVSMYFYL